MGTWETLFIVSSKTFTTLEAMTNARTARDDRAGRWALGLARAEDRRGQQRAAPPNLFCGMILVSLGQLIDFYAVQEEAWSSELLEAAAFVPLLIFALYVAAPMRLLLLSRRREVLFWVLGILIFAGVLLGPVGVFVISLGWLHGREPYPLIGLGLLFSLPADILEHYHLLSHRAQQGQLALLFVLVSQLYFLVGALLAATRRKRAERGS
jgi:hypothetical protein